MSDIGRSVTRLPDFWQCTTQNTTVQSKNGYHSTIQRRKTHTNVLTTDPATCHVTLCTITFDELGRNELHTLLIVPGVVGGQRRATDGPHRVVDLTGGYIPVNVALQYHAQWYCNAVVQAASDNA
jgi:hypothetical protein